jgi:hypothetical protein
MESYSVTQGVVGRKAWRPRSFWRQVSSSCTMRVAGRLQLRPVRLGPSREIDREIVPAPKRRRIPAALPLNEDNLSFSPPTICRCGCRWCASATLRSPASVPIRQKSAPGPKASGSETSERHVVTKSLLKYGIAIHRHAQGRAAASGKKRLAR